MKKIIIALALVMTMSFAASAQDGFVADWSMGGDIFRTGGFLMPLLPMDHGLTTDEPAPLGSGLLILTAMGAGYAVARKRKSSR
ncbi:MAG: hypothetical protein J5708_06335 [Bacteroidales bacterium]|nr:hypothetical protein [Bacteroidales bacterium]